MTRVLVCGGRNFEDQAFADAVLNRIHSERGITLIIEGGARGADRLAVNWCDWGTKVPKQTYRADWNAHGKAAGVIRNQQMLDEGRPDLVVAFPGGRGTDDMVRRARMADIEVIEAKP